jgi:hypothetical protein
MPGGQMGRSHQLSHNTQMSIAVRRQFGALELGFAWIAS